MNPMLFVITIVSAIGLLFLSLKDVRTYSLVIKEEILTAKGPVRGRPEQMDYG